MEEMWTDDIGRSFCARHKRDACHECCYDFREMNEMAEVDAGLRKPPSQIEELTKQLSQLREGMKFMEQQPGGRVPAPMRDNYEFHRQELARVQTELRALVDADPDVISEIEAGTRKAHDKLAAEDADKRAVYDAWRKENNGRGGVMEWGGAETQRLYDKVASAPNQSSSASASTGVDTRTCSYCKKASAKRLQLCSRCRAVSYCNVTCQRAAWKGHKIECNKKAGEGSGAGGSPQKSKSDTKPEKRKKLPLTWAQLEAYGGAVATKKTLEVRAMVDESYGLRQVVKCKDTAGAVKRIAVYTDSRRIDGLVPGAVLKWKNPKFHRFMDGSDGARIENEDLKNIVIEK